MNLPKTPSTGERTASDIFKDAVPVALVVFPMYLGAAALLKARSDIGENHFNFAPAHAQFGPAVNLNPESEIVLDHWKPTNPGERSYGSFDYKGQHVKCFLTTEAPIVYSDPGDEIKVDIQKPAPNCFEPPQ